MVVRDIYILQIKRQSGCSEFCESAAHVFWSNLVRRQFCGMAISGDLDKPEVVIFGHFQANL